MLLLPVLEKEENENGGADELLPLWRKKEKHQWRGRSVVERMVVQPAVTVVAVAEGTTEKEKGEREREAAEKEEKQGRWLVFSPILDPIFSSFRSPMEPLFIGSGRG
jgi:hypothetical protein